MSKTRETKTVRVPATNGLKRFLDCHKSATALINTLKINNKSLYDGVIQQDGYVTVHVSFKVHEKLKKIGSQKNLSLGWTLLRCLAFNLPEILNNNDETDSQSGSYQPS